MSLSIQLLRLLFLDIDGVLNKGLVASASPKSDVLINFKYGWMNKSLVQNLNEITDQTGAKIVLSSAWRREKLKDNQKLLKAFGVTGEVIGQTPELDQYSVRGNEIKAWLTDNQALLGCCAHRFRQYIIIDDSADILLSQAEHFIKTDTYAGLSESATHQAKLKLKSLVNI